MALDEPRDGDLTEEIDGFTYLINEAFMEKVKPIKVDFMDIGFKLSCGVDFNAGGGGCSGCGTTSNCCS
jgi:hypothetical protein